MGLVVVISLLIVSEVIIVDDLLQLCRSVRKVSLGMQSLSQNCDVIIVLGSLHLCVNGANVHFLLVDHDHHLPLAFVFADATELRASERVLTHVVVWPLWFLANKNCVWRALVDSAHDLVLHLLELFCKHVFFDLCLQT